MSGNYLSQGARLSFSDAGSGLPVVLLHPTPLDGEYWRPLTKELAGIRAIVPELRGHGHSELGSGLPAGGFARVPCVPTLTMARLATDILELLDHLGVAKAVFGGCSIGGYVLLELWRRAPQRMRGMIFVCSKPQPDAEASLAKRVETIGRARAEGVAAIFDEMAQNTVAPSVRRERPEVVGEVRAQMTLTAEALVAVQAGLAARPDSVSNRGHHSRAGTGHRWRRGYQRDRRGHGGVPRRSRRMRVSRAAGRGTLCGVRTTEEGGRADGAVAAAV